MVNRIVMVNRILVVNRLVVVSGLAPRWGGEAALNPDSSVFLK